MSYLDLFGAQSTLPPTTDGLTQQHLDALQELINEGDRGGFYLAYYEMLKGVDVQYIDGGQAAKDAALGQVMMQAHISTYSGFFGGAALLGNRAENSRIQHITI